MAKMFTLLQKRGLEVRSPNANSGISELLERRGIKLPPIITTFHDNMSKQQVWRNNGGLISVPKYSNANIPEVSKWSSSSSQRSTGESTRNGASDNKSDSSDEPDSPFNPTETLEQRLERWQKFYMEKSMELYLDKDDYEEFLDEMLFDRLYEASSLNYRGQEQVRSFWDEVRNQLRNEEETMLEWPPTEELQHCTAWMYEDNALSHF
ncbi:hypothetical protein N431DRAFT_436702 [Stipitochalara longipes BDJ]|nr:hypothetical protein N431DRAFT_436702 [Stipitochalara longipes BDJ]